MARRDDEVPVEERPFSAGPVADLLKGIAIEGPAPARVVVPVLEAALSTAAEHLAQDLEINSADVWCGTAPYAAMLKVAREQVTRLTEALEEWLPKAEAERGHL